MPKGKEWDDWKEKNEFAALMMSDAPMEEKVRYAEERFNPSSS